MARGGRRSVTVTVYFTPRELALLDALRAALAAKTLAPEEHSRSTLVAALVRQEVDRLRQTGGDLPYAVLDALARAVAAVDADPEPAKRTGRPPTVPALR